jgi:hypothetical protein
MMKKLFQNLTYGLALCATSLTFGQISVTYVAAQPTQIGDAGTVSQPAKVTFTGIPDTNQALTFRARLYNTGTDITAGGQVAQTAFLDLNKSITYDNAQLKSTVTDNGSTYDVEIEFKLFSGASLTISNPPTVPNVDFTFRVFLNTTTPDFTGSTVAAEGTGTTHKNFRFNSNLPIVSEATLSNETFENISRSIYPNPASTELMVSRDIKTKTYKVVSLLGLTIKEVKANGSIDVSNLSKGIYILVTDTGVAKFVKK